MCSLQTLLRASQGEAEEGGGSAGRGGTLGRLLVWGVLLFCFILLAILLMGVAKEGRPRLPVFGCQDALPKVVDSVPPPGPAREWEMLSSALRYDCYPST